MIEDPFNPPITIRGNRKNIPKDIHIFSTVPVIFETKKQYVNELIKNQEKKRGVNFSKKEEDQFRKSELKTMQPVIARYTTQSNPYMPAETVFFTDHKISKDMLREEARHEMQHQAWEPFDGPGVKNMVQPYHGNIDKQTTNNTFYRNTLFTGAHSQLILMALKSHEAIGNEVHKVDQFFRIEQGQAKFILANGKKTFIMGPGGAVTVPAGTWHNVIALDRPVKLYTIYSPANHPPHTMEKVRPKND